VAVALCLLQVSVLSKGLGGLSWFLAWGLPSTYPILCFKDIQALTVTLLNCYYYKNGWFGSRVISVLDLGAEGPGFISQPRRCRVIVLGKLFTPIVPVFAKQQNGSNSLKGCEGNCRPGRK